MGSTLFQDSETDIYKIPKNIESHGHSSVLNPGHKYFLLVDTGTTWEQSRELNKFCAELLKKLKGMSFCLSRMVRKPVFRVSDPVRHKPGCTATEDG